MFLLRAVKLRYGSHGFTSFRRKSYSGFLCSEKNPSTPAGFEPAKLGSSGEYYNHGTTGVDIHVISGATRLKVPTDDVPTVCAYTVISPSMKRKAGYFSVHHPVSGAARQVDLVKS